MNLYFSRKFYEKDLTELSSTLLTYDKSRDCYVIVEHQSISVLLLRLYFHLKRVKKSTSKNSEI